MTEDIKKIREMMEFLVKQRISEKLTKLATKEKVVYDLTGVKSITVKDIVKKSGFSAGKISSLWQKWEAEGLLVKDGKSYRKVV